MKLNIYITDPEDFLAGKLGHSLRLTDRHHEDDYCGYLKDYIYAGSVDVDINVDSKEIRQKAVNAIDKEIQETRAQLQHKVDDLEIRKQNLLALEHVA